MPIAVLFARCVTLSRLAVVIAMAFVQGTMPAWAESREFIRKEVRFAVGSEEILASTVTVRALGISNEHLSNVDPEVRLELSLDLTSWKRALFDRIGRIARGDVCDELYRANISNVFSAGKTVTVLVSISGYRYLCTTIEVPELRRGKLIVVRKQVRSDLGKVAEGEHESTLTILSSSQRAQILYLEHCRAGALCAKLGSPEIYAAVEPLRQLVENEMLSVDRLRLILPDGLSRFEVRPLDASFEGLGRDEPRLTSTWALKVPRSELKTIKLLVGL